MPPPHAKTSSSNGRASRDTSPLAPRRSIGSPVEARRDSDGETCRSVQKFHTDCHLLGESRACTSDASRLLVCSSQYRPGKPITRGRRRISGSHRHFVDTDDAHGWRRMETDGDGGRCMPMMRTLRMIQMIQMIQILVILCHVMCSMKFHGAATWANNIG